jgi:RNA polymerase sigma factor (sigma-70 family)
METDAQLLGRYVKDRDENAFAEVVQRHLALVHAAACRETQGDEALAKDVSQLVFVELARQAGRLTQHPALAGWLYTSVRRVYANLRRSDQRRMRREQEVFTMNPSTPATASEPSWVELQPVIDDALHELKESDRHAVVLRFFKGQSFSEIGSTLNLTENTARMRVERALDKLRGLLARRGVKSSTTGLAAALGVANLNSVPTAYATAISHAAVLAAAAAPTVSALTILGTMTKLKLTTAGLAIIVALALPIWQQTQVHRLTNENAALCEKLDTARAQLAAIPASPPVSNVAGLNEKDFRELLRLRGEVGGLRNRLKQANQLQSTLKSTNASDMVASSDSQATTNFTAKLNTVVGKGQTLVTGGWAVEPGRRCFVFITPTIDAGNDPSASKTVSCTSKFVTMPDDLVEQAGLKDYASQETVISKGGLYSEDQTRELMKMLEATSKVDLLASPRITVLDGQQGEVENGNEAIHGPKINVTPTITADDGVNISLTAEVPKPISSYDEVHRAMTVPVTEAPTGNP